MGRPVEAKLRLSRWEEENAGRPSPRPETWSLSLAASRPTKSGSGSLYERALGDPQGLPEQAEADTHRATVLRRDRRHLAAPAQRP